jgi:hypothetical protein
MQTTSKPASSLVIVLLTIAASSVVILSGASALINTARQRGSGESRNVANQLADSALQDGYYRFANASGGSLNSIGQYPLSGLGNSLTAATHGFTVGSSCATLASDAEPVDPDCPTYQVAVRSVVTPAVPATGYTYTSRDLPTSEPIKLWLPSFSGIITFNSSACVGCAFTLEGLDQNGNLILGQTYTLNGTQSLVNTSIKSVRVTATNYNTAVNGTAHRAAFTVSSPNAFTIGTGFTSIEATGIATDGTTVRKLAIFRLSDTTSIGNPKAINKSLKTITQQFAPEGYCKPVADACR